MSPNDQEITKKQLYEEVCKSYHAVDNFRAKLLGFLPLTSGGIFILLRTDIVSLNKEYILPIGVFGFLVTLGLFIYELQGVQRCSALIAVGKCLEQPSNNVIGQFTGRPTDIPIMASKNQNCRNNRNNQNNQKNWTIRLYEPLASCLIYSTVLAGWIFLALSVKGIDVCISLISLLVWMVSLFFSLYYYVQKIENNTKRHIK